MGKADKMVERNKKVSREKAESVCKEIERMLANKERISPQELVRRTGVSRGFLYKNPVVSERMRQARIRQMDGQFIPVQKTILDSAMERTLELQKEQLRKKNEEVEALQKECKKLREALGKKSLKSLL